MTLVSPFTSIRAVVENGGGAYQSLGSMGASLISERFDTLSVIPRIKCPTVIFHGEEDEICPIEHAEESHTDPTPS